MSVSGTFFHSKQRFLFKSSVPTGLREKIHNLIQRLKPLAIRSSVPNWTEPTIGGDREEVG